MLKLHMDMPKVKTAPEKPGSERRVAAMDKQIGTPVRESDGLAGSGIKIEGRPST